MAFCNKCNTRYAKLWDTDKDAVCTRGWRCASIVGDSENQGHYIECAYGSFFDCFVFTFKSEDVSKPLLGFNICDDCIKTLWKNGDVTQVASIGPSTYSEFLSEVKENEVDN